MGKTKQDGARKILPPLSLLPVSIFLFALYLSKLTLSTEFTVLCHWQYCNENLILNVNLNNPPLFLNGASKKIQILVFGRWP